MVKRLHIAIEDNTATQYYHASLLDESDTKRTQQHPTLHDKLDWRVSRVLKARIQHFENEAPLRYSLSHRYGYAACAAAFAQDVQSLGVDLEFMSPRDFAAFSKWICRDDEIAFQAQSGWGRASFYRLWTVKEALIKATGLQFPADMRRVGCISNQGEIQLVTPQQNTWCGRSWIVDHHWMLSVVWLPAEQTETMFTCEVQTSLTVCEYGRYG